MNALKWTCVGVGVLAVAFGAFALYFSLIINPVMVNEIRTNPEGEEAREAMILTFEGRTLPVNYLKEGNTVFMGVDGRWWRAFTGDGIPVSMLIQGQSYDGIGVVVLDDPEYRQSVFSRLRPTAPDWLPEWLTGKLVVITIDGNDAG